MVQDWGYEYLYLRHETAITRVNLKNHSHRDVTYTPMEEFDSASSENSDSTEEKDQENLWVCGASRKSVMTDGSEWCKDVMNEAYIPIPFQEEKLKPEEWTQEFAILGVKDEIYTLVPSKKDKLEPTEGDHGLATLNVKDEAYIPAPFEEEELEPVEWSHVLAALDVCSLNHGG